MVQLTKTDFFLFLILNSINFINSRYNISWKYTLISAHIFNNFGTEFKNFLLEMSRKNQYLKILSYTKKMPAATAQNSFHKNLLSKKFCLKTAKKLRDRKKI
jgi:hypothetical protein